MSKSSNQNTDTDPTDTSAFHQEIIQCKEKIVSLEETLASKDRIIYFLSHNIFYQNTQSLS